MKNQNPPSTFNPINYMLKCFTIACLITTPLYYFTIKSISDKSIQKEEYKTQLQEDILSYVEEVDGQPGISLTDKVDFYQKAEMATHKADVSRPLSFISGRYNLSSPEEKLTISQLENILNKYQNQE
jgi:hypothetical protein